MHSHQHNPLTFPKNFLWGAATSAHQVEGYNTNNDWSLVADSGLSDAGKAGDHYHLFEKDFDAAHELNHNAHRFSVEWSRIEPEENTWDEKELEHYCSVIRALLNRGLEPFVTLHHFTLPLWLYHKGGWANKKAPEYFNRYVSYLMKHLPHEVRFWITINEPLVYISQGYIRKKWPPFKKNDIVHALLVFSHMESAHKRAYHTIHAMRSNAHVGIAHSASSFHAYRKHKLGDQLFEMMLDFLVNHSFFRFSKKFHDFLGINYYIHYRIYEVHPHLIKNPLQFQDIAKQYREVSDVGWEVYPQGIFNILVDFKDMGLPIYITENGIATKNDHKRTRFIISHLKEIYHAIHAGVDIRGYFHWSLLDNYEWDKGFAPRFGLLGVNYETLERTVQDSARVYARICKENAISHDLLHYLGHET